MSCSVFELSQRALHFSQFARVANEQLERDCDPMARVRSGGAKPLQMSTTCAVTTDVTKSTETEGEGSAASDVESLSELSDAPSSLVFSILEQLAMGDGTCAYTNPLACPTTTTINSIDSALSESITLVNNDHPTAAPARTTLDSDVPVVADLVQSPTLHDVTECSICVEADKEADHVALAVSLFVPVPGSSVPFQEMETDAAAGGITIDSAPSPSPSAPKPKKSATLIVEQGLLAAPFDFHGPPPPLWPRSPPMTSILAAVGDADCLGYFDSRDAGLLSEDNLESMRVDYGGQGSNEDSPRDDENEKKKPRCLRMSLKGVKKWVGRRISKLRGAH